MKTTGLTPIHVRAVPEHGAAVDSAGQQNTSHAQPRQRGALALPPSPRASSPRALSPRLSELPSDLGEAIVNRMDPKTLATYAETSRASKALSAKPLSLHKHHHETRKALEADKAPLTRNTGSPEDFAMYGIRRYKDLIG
ncbi:F-box protein [Ralstonia solanacearum]|uniref:F-box domain-containing protein n=1 Tax=Ralstonia solanacearum (strain Po82) TaxID=1031711 RepID=F6G9V3_RALS8|nr:F-box protein [Ralstonia solanacearum]AEG71321.1 conserved hypothetical protein [Ralstonia solanacearum Po82]AYB62706.1 F-box domain-containing protein [Ralstonia solanacearum]MBB6589218.1 F-box protein [Ralstonia solanacearum]MCG3575402.1 F-box protein [Ralstonia solanacearum]MCL9826387.1 F-box protein [Ralstonia solanacearum]